MACPSSSCCHDPNRPLPCRRLLRPAGAHQLGLRGLPRVGAAGLRRLVGRDIDRARAAPARDSFLGRAEIQTSRLHAAAATWIVAAIDADAIDDRSWPIAFQASHLWSWQSQIFSLVTKWQSCLTALPGQARTAGESTSKRKHRQSAAILFASARIQVHCSGLPCS